MAATFSLYIQVFDISEAVPLFSLQDPLWNPIFDGHGALFSGNSKNDVIMISKTTYPSFPQQPRIDPKTEKHGSTVWALPGHPIVLLALSLCFLSFF